MRISPLDVRSQEFKKGLRGYDPEEVKAFLDSIADTMEELLKEKETAEAELASLRKKVETFTEMEMSLRDAMVAAQKAADEAKMNARRNAELMIREAELEVRQRIADAKRQVDDVFKARETVRAEMRAFLPRLRSLLESQLTYLENIEQEVKGMDLGDGDPVEAKEVRSFTETVASRAREAEGRVRDESVRREQHSVKRREQIARGRAVEAAAVSQRAAKEAPQQAAQQQAPPQQAAQHHEAPREGGHQRPAGQQPAEREGKDPLDAAMQQHHEKQVHWQDRPKNEGHHDGGPGGQRAEQQHGEEQHAEQHHAEHHHGGDQHQEQHHGDQQHQEQHHGDQQHQEQHHGDQQHQEQHHAGQDAGGQQAQAPVRDMTWSPRPDEDAPESGEELPISHAPQPEHGSEKREDVNA